MWQLGIFSKVMLMYALGMANFPRWVVDYLPLPEWVTAQFWLTIAGYLIGLGFALFLLNMVSSASRGRPVGASDPWPVKETPLPEASAPAPALKETTK